MAARLLLLASLVATASIPAYAADDASYCQVLATEYQKYYVKSDGHSPRPGPIDGNLAADQCRAGNVAGIPVLEKKLRDAKVALPPRF